jgi:hypothetical protein
VQNSEDGRDWYFEFWFLFIFGPMEKRQWPFWIIAWMCSATCTIAFSSAGDVEREKLG